MKILLTFIIIVFAQNLHSQSFDKKNTKSY